MSDQGKANYEGYSAAVMAPMPKWDELSYRAKLGWDAGACSVEACLAEGQDASGSAAENALLRDQALAAVDKFESDLGFTAPELIGMRIEQLRAMVHAVFEGDDDWFEVEVGDADAGTLPAEPRPAPELAAAMADPQLLLGPCKAQGHDGEHLQLRTHEHWLCAHTLANMLVASGVTDDVSERLEQLRKRFAYVAAALDSDALATQPSKKSQIQADAARRIREALA